MKIGIVFFSLVKMFQGKPKPKLSPEKYILVSENEVLRGKLENKWQTVVERQDITKSFAKNAKTEIIFDQNYINFKSIIQSFETNKNKGLTFKIIPESSDYVIGSNSSFDRGEVINI